MIWENQMFIFHVAVISNHNTFLIEHKNYVSVDFKLVIFFGVAFCLAKFLKICFDIDEISIYIF